MGKIVAYSAEGGMLAERLANIENRLHDNMNRLADSMIDIGRCLNQAKDEKLVPHGQWAEWVQTHTGFTVRQAQRYMQVAREVSNTSTLSHLEFSKVHALLALPPAERESFAEEVGADDLSVRELKEAISEKLEAARRETEEERNKRIELENSMRIREAQAAAERSQLLQEMVGIREELETAKSNNAAQDEIDRLQAEIEEQEEEIIRRANAEAKVKAELLNLRAQVARGDVSTSSGGDTLTPEELGNITRGFIGRAAVLPHMRAHFATCDSNTRAAYRANVEMLADWCERALRAIDTINGEAIVIE